MQVNQLNLTVIDFY